MTTIERAGRWISGHTFIGNFEWFDNQSPDAAHGDPGRAREVPVTVRCGCRSCPSTCARSSERAA